MVDLPQGPSTASTERLPEPTELRKLTQAIAMLDTILCPEWESRYFSFNSKWGIGEEMASMRDGEGEEWFLLFSAPGAALKGFSRNTSLERSRQMAAAVQDKVPKEFSSFLGEPAFAMDMVSFCLWRRLSDDRWNVVRVNGASVDAIEDGSADLLWILDGTPSTYQRWAEAYYETDVPLDAVELLYRHRPLNDELVRMLNPSLSIINVIEGAAEISYPLE